VREQAGCERDVDRHGGDEGPRANPIAERDQNGAEEPELERPEATR
jgi:hypothetical protein